MYVRSVNVTVTGLVAGARRRFLAKKAAQVIIFEVKHKSSQVAGLLLLLLFGLWVIADRLEPCVVPTRRCRSLTVTADLRSWAPSYKTRPTYYLSARPDGR